MRPASGALAGVVLFSAAAPGIGQTSTVDWTPGRPHRRCIADYKEHLDAFLPYANNVVVHCGGMGWVSTPELIQARSKSVHLHPYLYYMILRLLICLLSGIR